MLPRKVGKMVSIFGEDSFEENDGCFLLCTTDSVVLVKGSTQEAHTVAY